MCRTSYRNPVFAGYLADPFVFRHDDAYWAVGTDPFAAATSAESHATIFPVLRSSDLASWVSVGRALIAPDASLGDTFWAPEVLFHEGSFHLYYSVGFDDRLHHLRVATSKNPDGPYRDAGVALTDPRTREITQVDLMDQTRKQILAKLPPELRVSVAEVAAINAGAATTRKRP